MSSKEKKTHKIMDLDTDIDRNGKQGVGGDI